MNKPLSLKRNPLLSPIDQKHLDHAAFSVNLGLMSKYAYYKLRKAILSSY